MNLVSSQSNEFDFFFEHPVQWIHRFNGYITVNGFACDFFYFSPNEFYFPTVQISKV